jgi:hypothetical protein
MTTFTFLSHSIFHHFIGMTAENIERKELKAMNSAANSGESSEMTASGSISVSIVVKHESVESLSVQRL